MDVFAIIVQVLMLLILVSCILLFVSKKFYPKLQIPKKHDVTYFSFEVEGVTEQNEDGSDRQQIISDIRSQSIKGGKMNLREYSDNGSPALAVLMNEKQVGVVPSEYVEYLLIEIDKGTLVSGECEFLPADCYTRVKMTIAICSDPNKIPNTRSAWREVIPQYKPYYADSLPDSYVVFDLETSGLDPSKYEIVEIGAIRFESGNETGRYHTYVKPVSPIPTHASNINGITNDMLKDAPQFNAISSDFLSFIKDLPLVAHNARFDIHFLQTELGHWVKNEIIDTLKLSRNLIPGLENYKLETLKHYFDVPVGSHNALDDCIVTAKVYQECAKLSRERWLQNRPCIDRTIPDNVERMDDRSRSYYQAIQNILQKNGKKVEDIHASLFKNERDFAINIDDMRLCKIVFLKKQNYIALVCSENEAREILDANQYEHQHDSDSKIYRIVLPNLESLEPLSPIICRCFDEVRMNFQ